MHEPLPSQPIETLLSSRPDVWRGRQRPTGPVLSSGRAELDAWLPAGGWPSGRLIELLPAHFGLGELTLVLPLIAHQTSQGMPVILAGPPLVPCPQHLARSGVALDRLVVVRKSDQAFWGCRTKPQERSVRRSHSVASVQFTASARGPPAAAGGRKWPGPGVCLLPARPATAAIAGRAASGHPPRTGAGCAARPE